MDSGPNAGSGRGEKETKLLEDDGDRGDRVANGVQKNVSIPTTNSDSLLRKYSKPGR